MVAVLLEWLRGLPRELVVVLLGALPIAELRGAIPLALYYGMTLPKAYTLAVIGNFLPVIPLLVLLEPVSSKLRRFPLWARFFDWLFERTRRRAETVQKYEAIGLMLFVAIPLPVTGAWTAAVAALLFKIRFRYALPAICAGILLAGVVVSVLCSLGMLSWQAIN